MGIINRIYTYWSTDICSLARKIYAFKPRKMPTDINVIATQNLIQWKTAEVRGNKPFHGLLRF